MNNHYTSYELSKKLAENGCTVVSEHKIYEKYKTTHIDTDKRGYTKSEGYGECYPTYDLIYDVCFKPKEFFGTEMTPIIRTSNLSFKSTEAGYDFVHKNITRKIFRLVQQNKINEAEELIWITCVFNKKNKEKK